MPTTRRTLILALLLVAGGSLAFATGAAMVNGPTDTIAEDRLAIQPADGPNGQYAYLTEDDEIAIDVSASNPNIRDPSFEGVNVGTTGTIDDVFTITYTAERYAHVWIEYDGDGEVAFVADGDSIEGEANNVTLAPNETVTVGLALDASDATAGTRLGADEFSIGAKVAEPEEADDVGGSTRRADDDDDDGTATTVRSPGRAQRRFVVSGASSGETVRLDADGMHLDGENLTLDRLDLTGVPGGDLALDAAGATDPTELNGTGALDAPTTPRSTGYLSLGYDVTPDEIDSVTLRFSADAQYLNDTGTDPEDVTLYRETDAGDWEEVPVEVVGEEVVRLRGLPEDRVHFRATTEAGSSFAVAERTPRYDVTDVTLAEGAVETGDTVAVTATVTNGGGAAGNRTVALTANGTTVGSETVTLDPNGTTTVAFDVRFDRPGEYELAVDGASVGPLLVGDPEVDGDADGASDTDAAAGDPPSTDDGSDPTTGPLEEPSAIDLSDLVGLVSLLAMVVVGVVLVRRRPGA